MTTPEEMTFEESLSHVSNTIIQSLVRNPGQAHIVITEDELGTLVSVHVARSDMGLVIGKQGSTVSSIRTILHSIGIKFAKKVNLKVHEPEGGERKFHNRPMESLKDKVGAI